MSATTHDTHMRGAVTAELLRDAFPEHAAKHAARAADVSHRTTEAWVAGRREPSASVLIRAIAEDTRLEAALSRLVADLRARRDAVRAERLAARATRGKAVTP
jgi:hypothetical protein